MPTLPSFMAFFKRKEKAPAEVQRLDWKLLERGAVALYYKSPVLSADLAWFRQQAYTVHEVNAAPWSAPADFYADAQQAFNFPVHYSRNLASWIECLAELPVPDESGTVIVFRRYDAFAKAQPQLAQTILDSIETTSRLFLLTGRRLLALVQSDDPRIRFERVGAMPVTWNPREWLDADRGMGRTE
ncbi:MAG TPA: barstar family protein [Gemmatimonadaceae bacterium]|nr:barstar family protein [Gemmatimonadaceae bacterium]